MPSPNHPPTALSTSAKSRKAKTVTAYGFVLNVVLAIVKITAGLVSGSYALLIDGFHSLSDLATDIMVYVLSHIAHEEADAEHPYGHGRFENFGTLMLGSFLIAVAGGIGYSGVERLIAGTHQPILGTAALAVAAFSILLNEWIYRFTLKTGKEINSELLIANAWHSRSDSLSSVVVVIGIIGTMAGVFWLDTAAAILVAGMIGHMGFSLAWSNAKQLVDTALPVEEVDKISAAILQIEGIRSIHSLRTRKSGSMVFVDLHIEVDSRASVSEGHQIGQWVTLKLLREFPSIEDVTFHIDSGEDFHIERPLEEVSLQPLRNKLQQQLTDAWSSIEAAQQIHEIRLNYLTTGLFAEVHLPLSAQSVENIEEQLIQAIDEQHLNIRLHFWYGDPVEQEKTVAAHDTVIP
ncbi:MAG: cation diffusion facilitator family transporter [Pseudomonadales bacterium]|nr:cation diffusion facilitator family transporter [Pseudomonadales bacterium]